MSADIVVRRVRRLPIKGKVLVQVGDKVSPSTELARAELLGPLQTIKLTDKLGLEPSDAVAMSLLKPGDPIQKGTLVAQTKGLFGLFSQQVKSDFAGTVEEVSDITGSLLIREPSVPVSIDAYVEGKVVEVMDEEGAVVESRCAMVQGIFGVGGERTGIVRVACAKASDVLTPDLIQATDDGKILIAGSGVTADAIKQAASVGARAIITGGIKDSDLIAFLGYDIGVAITGTEQIPLTIVVTEGFGILAMADRTFKLLQTLEGKAGSINGATQIRAGVIRPELLVPLEGQQVGEPTAESPSSLGVGTAIRIIREPYFGKLGTVTQLPAQLVKVDSGTEVRVLMAQLDTGETVTVPRANVEIIASS